MHSSEPINLHIPPQDLSEFALFSLTPEAAQQWAHSLPTANSAHVAQQLRGAISDLNRLPLSPAVRFEILESLRPTLHVAMVTLSKYYLNQPVVLPEEPQRAVSLACALHELTHIGYTIVAAEAIEQRDELFEMNPAELVCQGIHRAITSASLKALIEYQLYQPITLQLWSHLHQLYLIAERQNLARHAVEDELWGDGSITDTYLRAMLLGCCKPNQLRQRDLAGIFRGLREWVQDARLLPPGDNNGLFVIDLGGDHPPMYAALYQHADSDHYRYLNTDRMVSRLRMRREQRGNSPLVFDNFAAISPLVLEHLVSAWGVFTKRSFTRSPTREKLWVTVGLLNTHFYASGGLSFDRLLQTEEDYSEAATANPFLAGFDDEPAGWERTAPDTEVERELWDDAVLHADISVDEVASRIREGLRDGAFGPRHPVFPVRLSNSSPGGYCLEWTADIPSDTRTGDVIGVREVASNLWSIAIIRWVSRLRADMTLVGIELLSPRATAYGGRVLLPSGEHTEIMRVLLLPEITLVGQQASLLTPAVGFRERQRVTLIRGGTPRTIQLTRQLSSSPSFARFEFRDVAEAETRTPHVAGLEETPPPSLWDSI